MKLNLGSHNKTIGEDWINVDGLELPNVDLICDFNIVPFKYKENRSIGLENNLPINYIKFNDNSIDEIQMVEVLEHISFRNTEKVLKELYRIIKPNCKIHIQVPDCGKMMEYYVNKQICECVPHKSIQGNTEGDFKADKNCWNCKGKGMINPLRWLYSFTGAQKHKFDQHLMIFTKENLKEILQKVGFKKIEFKEHIYKLKVNCYKKLNENKII